MRRRRPGAPPPPSAASSSLLPSRSCLAPPWTPQDLAAASPSPAMAPAPATRPARAAALLHRALASLFLHSGQHRRHRISLHVRRGPPLPPDRPCRSFLSLAVRCCSALPPLAELPVTCIVYVLIPCCLFVVIAKATESRDARPPPWNFAKYTTDKTKRMLERVLNETPRPTRTTSWTNEYHDDRCSPSTPSDGQVPLQMYDYTVLRQVPRCPKPSDSSSPKVQVPLRTMYDDRRRRPV